MKFSIQFSRVRKRPILSKRPGLEPMVLNMADFCQCDISSETPYNVSHIL